MPNVPYLKKEREKETNVNRKKEREERERVGEKRAMPGNRIEIERTSPINRKN